MKNLVLSLILLAFSTTAFAQKMTQGSITTTNGTTLSGKVAIDYQKKIVLFQKSNERTIYAFDKLSSLQLDESTLEKSTINGDIYFLNPLSVSNAKASLYQINKNQYLLQREDGMAKVLDLKEDQSRIPGILSLLFNDCNSVRETLNSKTINSQAKLEAVFGEYLGCEQTTYAPSASEIEEANSYTSDQASFYVGAGLGLNNVTFFENSNNESLIAAQVGVGVIASPNFFGSIQGNLHFSLEGQASFSGEKDFGNAGDPVSFRVNTYRLLVGMEYHFNKTGKIQPLIGVSVGATGDYFKGQINGFDFEISGGNTLVTPRIGARFQLPNEKHLGVILTYIPEYTNDLQFRVDDILIPLDVNSQYLTLGLNYYF